MAKIVRQRHKVFSGAGVISAPTEFAEFGSQEAGVPLKTTDIQTIQALSAWDNGWQDAIFSGNKALLLEDLNSFSYEHSYQVGYLLQNGVPEWNAGTTYFIGSIVTRVGTAEEYASLVDNNLGNAVPVQASNGNWLWLNPPVTVPDVALAANQIPKISGASSIGPAGSKGLVPGLLSDDGTNIVIGGTAGVNGLQFPDATIQKTAAINTAVAAQAVVTGTRALNTVFHNTSARPLFISVCASGSGVNFITAYTDANPAPVAQVAQAGQGSSGATLEQLFFIVLPGNYYRVDGGGSAVMSIWTEWS